MWGLGATSCFPASSCTELAFKDSVWYLSDPLGLGLRQKRGNSEEERRTSHGLQLGFIFTQRGNPRKSEFFPLSRGVGKGAGDSLEPIPGWGSDPEHKGKTVEQFHA